MDNRSVGPWISCVLLAMALAGCNGKVERKGSAERSSSLEAGASRAGVVSPAAKLRGEFDSAKPAAATSEAFGFKPSRQYRHVIVDGPGVVIYDGVAAGDFNGDRRADVVAFGLGSQITVDVLLQKPDGTFAPPSSFPLGTNYLNQEFLIVNDFNGDGISDIAFDTVNAYGAQGGIGLLLSRRGQAPIFHQAYPATIAMANDMPADWASLDVDGDGYQDMVVSRSYVEQSTTSLACKNTLCPNYEVLHGDGKGNFGRSELVKLDIPEKISATATEDVDLDGLPDLVFVASNADDPLGGGRLLVAYRLRAGGLAWPARLQSTETGKPVLFGDINGDRLRDTLMGTEVHLRNPDGSFGPTLYLSTFMLNPATPVIADFNGDGLDDVVNHQFEDFLTPTFLAVYLGGGGTLQAPFRVYDTYYDHFFPVASGRHPYATGDFNGDGCRDLVVAIGPDGLAFLDGYNCIPQRIRTGGGIPPLPKG